MDNIDVQNDSGLGKGSEVPAEVRHFNWGAFWVTWIWGVCNNSYLTLISLAFNIITFTFGFIIPIIAALIASTNVGLGIGLLIGYSLFTLIGGIALRIWFGLKGNQWAWQNKKWNSTEHFNSVQKTWAIVSAVVSMVLILANVGVVAAMTIPSLISNTDKVRTKTMIKKEVSSLSQAVVMSEALGSKCGKKSSQEGIAKCLGERFNGQVIGNKIELNDGVDLIFHSGSRCINDGTCYVIIDTTSRAKGTEKVTIRLYSDRDGYIKLNEEDTQKIIDKYTSH